MKDNILNKLKNIILFLITKTRELLFSIVKDISLLSLEDIENILLPNIELTFDYLLLITSACIICTLGLLMNSTPIIVGGMIISPLMWPIVGASYSLWQSKKYYLYKSIRLLALSVIFTLFISAILTFLSPLKIINSEILTRTSPTLFDLIVALASGAVAMLALTNKRVSNSIAGVAIATSLLPPVCVSGIGIALLNFTVFWGGLLLFMTNAIAIVVVGVIYLIVTSVIQQKSLPPIDIRGILIIVIILFLLSIPLKSALIQYGWKLNSMQITRTIILDQLRLLHPDITLAGIQVESQQKIKTNRMLIDIGIVTPQNFVMTFDAKEKIRDILEKKLGQPVKLNIRIQQGLSILSANEEQYQTKERIITNTLREELSKINEDIVIDSISVVKKSLWKARAVLSLEPSTTLTEKDRLAIEAIIGEKLQENVSLSFDLIPRIKLNSDKDEQKNTIQKELGKIFTKQFPQADLITASLSVEATTSASPSSLLTVQIRMPQELYPMNSIVQAIRQGLKNIMSNEYIIRLRITPVEDTLFVN